MKDWHETEVATQEAMKAFVGRSYIYQADCVSVFMYERGTLRGMAKYQVVSEVVSPGGIRAAYYAILESWQTTSNSAAGQNHGIDRYSKFRLAWLVEEIERRLDRKSIAELFVCTTAAEEAFFRALLFRRPPEGMAPAEAEVNGKTLLHKRVDRWWQLHVHPIAPPRRAAADYTGEAKVVHDRLKQLMDEGLVEELEKFLISKVDTCKANDADNPFKMC